jgi:hypothetical protein
MDSLFLSAFQAAVLGLQGAWRREQCSKPSNVQNHPTPAQHLTIRVDKLVILAQFEQLTTVSDD